MDKTRKLTTHYQYTKRYMCKLCVLINLSAYLGSGIFERNQKGTAPSLVAFKENSVQISDFFIEV